MATKLQFIGRKSSRWEQVKIFKMEAEIRCTLKKDELDFRYCLGRLRDIQISDGLHYLPTGPVKRPGDLRN